MKTWALDVNGDIAIENRKPKITVSVSDYVAEKLKTKLRLFLGEWFLDVEAGYPYFQNMFKKNPDINLLNSIYQQQIREIDGVEEITQYDSGYDNSIRQCSVTFKVRCTDGGTIEGNL